MALPASSGSPLRHSILYLWTTLWCAPKNESLQQKITPIYKNLEGWNSSTFGLTKWSELPMQAQNYISTIEDLLEKKMNDKSYSLYKLISSELSEYESNDLSRSYSNELREKLCC